jgi:hypothetical protein
MLIFFDDTSKEKAERDAMLKPAYQGCSPFSIADGRLM